MTLRRLLAWALPLALISTAAVPLALVWSTRGIVAHLPGGAAASGAPGGAGSRGIGDPYFPDAGNGGYDVGRYRIFIDWDPHQQSIRATTTISARATAALTSFYVDLALSVDAVRVDNQPATFRREGPTNWVITPAASIPEGASFQVKVDYSGRPGDVPQREDPGWWVTGEEWTAAGEPRSSTFWFPANDHPSDPALMDVSIRVPTGFQAISVGRLEARDEGRDEAYDTWRWISRQPMATYASFLSIGHYEIKEGTDDGLPYVYAVSQALPAPARTQAFDRLLSSAARIRTLESMFGPYPFTELGGLVPGHEFWFDGLETQTRPIYDRRSIADDRSFSQLLNHELAHMWFGDNVTVREWNDIFDNEAYASWAAWACAERAGGPSAEQAFTQTYERLVDRPRFWAIPMADPGRDHLFDAVYQRGPMTLQALRDVIGDDAFFGLATEWAQSPGTRSLEDWMAMAQTTTSIDLGPFFQAWIYASAAPARTAANGFR